MRFFEPNSSPRARSAFINMRLVRVARAAASPQRRPATRFTLVRGLRRLLPEYTHVIPQFSERKIDWHPNRQDSRFGMPFLTYVRWHDIIKRALRPRRRRTARYNRIKNKRTASQSSVIQQSRSTINPYCRRPRRPIRRRPEYRRRL